MEDKSMNKFKYLEILRLADKFESRSYYNIIIKKSQDTKNTAWNSDDEIDSFSKLNNQASSFKETIGRLAKRANNGNQVLKNKTHQDIIFGTSKSRPKMHSEYYINLLDKAIRHSDSQIKSIEILKKSKKNPDDTQITGFQKIKQKISTFLSKFENEVMSYLESNSISESSGS